MYFACTLYLSLLYKGSEKQLLIFCIFIGKNNRLQVEKVSSLLLVSFYVAVKPHPIYY